VSLKFFAICPIFGIDDLKDLKAPMYCRGELAAEDQELMIIDCGICYANKTIDLRWCFGMPDRMRPDRKHRATCNPKDVFSS
jgi:hypothetical protein